MTEKCRLFSKSDGTVYGKVSETPYGSFKAYWVVPIGYFSGGTDKIIGEYSTEDSAITHMEAWIENKWEEQRLAMERLEPKKCFFDLFKR